MCEEEYKLKETDEEEGDVCDGAILPGGGGIKVPFPRTSFSHAQTPKRFKPFLAIGLVIFLV